MYLMRRLFEKEIILRQGLLWLDYAVPCDATRCLALSCLAL